MLKTKIAYLILIFSVAMCKNKVEDHAHNESAGSGHQSDTDLVSVIPKHEARLMVKPVKTPIRIQAGRPTKFSANLNVKLANDLSEVRVASKLPTTVLNSGKDGSLRSIEVHPQVIACLQPLPVKASSPRFKDAAVSDIQYLDVDQGMSFSSVKCIINDKRQNLWFGTNGGGVSRYDGQTFLHFTEDNGLSNNTILTMLEDSRGNIWMGTEGGGLCCYTGSQYLWFTENEGLGNNTVLSLCESKNGNIWIGTNGGGVFSYDGKKLTAYTENEGLSNNNVRCILEDSKGNLWFGTTGSGLCKFDGKSFTTLGEDEGLNSSIIHALCEGPDGTLYIATDDGGVNMFDGKTIKYLTKKRGLSSDCIVSLHLDQESILWIGTYDNGLCKYDGAKITVYNTAQGLSNNYILSICEDNSGSLWLATHGGGVCRFNTGSFKHYTETEGLGSNTVRSIIVDADQNLWLGTFGDGAIFYNGKEFSHYTEKEGLPSNRIKAAAMDKSGKLWFGTEQYGAVCFNLSKEKDKSLGQADYVKTFDHFTEEQGLNSDDIMSVYADREGRVWFGTNESGVCAYNGKEFISFKDEDGLSDGIISAIMQDKHGNLWFGTDGQGACCFDGQFLRWYNTKTGLIGNTIRCIYEDKDGNLWFGTEGKGISILSSESINAEKPSFKHFSDADGLSNNSINSIIQDQSGNFWIATSRGLNFLSHLRTDLEIHKYSTADGLKANDFFKCVALDNNNTIWWGNGKALTKLELGNLKISAIPPLLQLNSIALEKTFIDFTLLSDSINSLGKFEIGDKDKKGLCGIKFNGVEKFQNYPKNLVLPFDINQLEFEFVALDWAAPNKIKYQCILDGSESEWSPLTVDNKASYNNLPPGNYVFKVRAVGIANTWSALLEYPFIIRPPWYKTVWAYAGYFFAFIGIVFGFNNVRTRQLKIRQLELEHLVLDRTTEVVAQKELIETKQKEIVDSINYARRIQGAILASEQLLDKHLKNYFVLFRPKDIVSGDFYWASPVVEGKFVLVTADSTGHGVPGAMMSMLNISCLNEAVNERKLTSPAAILDHARQRIISSLAEDGSEEGGKDGMDCSVVLLDFKNSLLTYAGANNPIWIIRRAPHSSGEGGGGNAELIALKPERMPVGKHAKDHLPFSEQIFRLEAGDVIYTFTDGYSDQFGGPRAKKFTSKRLQETLLKIHSDNSPEQKAQLSNVFDNWRGSLEQVDDVLIIGVKI
jgi:ligand-binding sensor domain-containing protein/serine phosphatase RsbU (regulator of sigma subunit)